jgi:hypothetical protein
MEKHANERGQENGRRKANENERGSGREAGKEST